MPPHDELLPPVPFGKCRDTAVRLPSACSGAKIEISSSRAIRVRLMIEGGTGGLRPRASGGTVVHKADLRFGLFTPMLGPSPTLVHTSGTHGQCSGLARFEDALWIRGGISKVYSVCAGE